MRSAARGLLAVVLGALCAQGQVRVRGRVVDENNAPLAGAEVFLRFENRHVTAFSDPTGGFTLTIPNVGEYPITVILPGYFELRDHRIALHSGWNEVSLVLNRVRDVLESMDVSGVSSGLEVDKPAAEERLTAAELLDVPYRTNNNPVSALRISPGVVTDTSGNVHVNGGSSNQAAYRLDGFNIADPLTGTFQSRLSVESVQSMSVINGSVPAEYGNGSSGVVTVNTRMGDDKFRYSATNFLPGVEYRKELIVGSWTPRFNFSGPIRKGRAWFSDSLTAQYSKDVVQELPRGQDQTSSWRYSNLLRAQVNLTPSNILYAGVLINQSAALRNGLSALDPQETTVDRRANQEFLDAKDQIYLGRGSLVEFGYAATRTFGRQIPQGHDLYIFTPFGRRGNYFIDGRQRASRDEWLANYFFPSFSWAGGHQLKAGVDLDRVNYWQDMRRTGFLNFRVDSTPVRKVTFTGNGRLDRRNLETAAYLQDSWRVRPGLMIELGLRSDWDQILRNWNTSPRLAFAWAPFGLERTKVSGGYGLLYDATNLGLFARAADQHAVSTLYTGGPPLYTISSFLIGKHHLDSPRAHNFNLGIDQQLGSGLFASVRGILRRGSHGLSYFDTTGLAPTTVYSLLDHRRDSYAAMEFTARQNLRKQYEWLVSYTRSRAASNAVIDLSVDEPLIVPSNYGRLPWDAPNRLISWGYLPTPWRNWALACLFEWRSGFPYSVRDELGRVIGSADGGRFPDFLELDVHIERQFDFRGQRWAWRMGVNNITDHHNPEFVNNDIDSPEYRTFYGARGPTVAVRVRWLGKL